MRSRWFSIARLSRNGAPPGDGLATTLVDLGLTANGRAQGQADVSQSAPPAAPTPDTRLESIRRMPNAIMRRAEVERETGLSRSTIYQRVKAGTFPVPVHLGARSVGWHVSDIEAFLSSPTAPGHWLGRQTLMYRVPC